MKAEPPSAVISAGSAVGRVSGDIRQSRQIARQRAITEVVMAEGSIRIDELANRFGASVMTIHRDLQELASRGLMRKGRGVVTATSTSLVESSDVYRVGKQAREKEALAEASVQLLQPGQAVLLDDSTTVARIIPHLVHVVPITVITNCITLMNSLRTASGVTLVGLGGQYYEWCSAFMGPLTNQAISNLHADVCIMSTAAIVDYVAFHQSPDSVATKRVMFEAATTRVLLVDHTKFARQALHAICPLRNFDVVIVDDQTPFEHRRYLERVGVNVLVANSRQKRVSQQQSHPSR